MARSTSGEVAGLSRRPGGIDTRTRYNVAFVQMARTPAPQAENSGSTPESDSMAPPADPAPTLRTLVGEVQLLSGLRRRAQERTGLSYGLRRTVQVRPPVPCALRPMGGPLSYKQQTKVRFLQRVPRRVKPRGLGDRLLTESCLLGMAFDWSALLRWTGGRMERPRIANPKLASSILALPSICTQSVGGHTAPCQGVIPGPTPGGCSHAAVSERIRTLPSKQETRRVRLTPLEQAAPAPRGRQPHF